MIVPFGHVVFLAGVLFALGMFCSLARRNLLLILLGVEIMLNAGALLLVAGSLRWGQLEGQAFVLMVLAVAAAEVSVGLAMVVSAYRRTGAIDPAPEDLQGSAARGERP